MPASPSSHRARCFALTLLITETTLSSPTLAPPRIHVAHGAEWWPSVALPDIRPAQYSARMVEFVRSAGKALAGMLKRALVSAGQHATALTWSALLRMGFVLVHLLALAAVGYALMKVSEKVSWVLAGSVGSLIILILIRVRHRWRGLVGEWLVRTTLAVWFRKGIRLNDIYLPLGDSITQIDHILVCSRGIFVVETKYWTGDYFVTGDKWERVSDRGHRYEVFNPIRQNSGHIDAVRALLDDHGSGPEPIALPQLSSAAAVALWPTATRL